MKRNLTVFILLSIGLIGISACRKDDTLAPVITLKGESPFYLSLEHPFENPGATVFDNQDRDNIAVVSDNSLVNPNVKRAGIYVITYQSTDKSGNTGYASRTVIVRNDAYMIEGGYNVLDTANSDSLYYAQTITADTAKNNRVHFNKFANYGYNTKIYGDLNASHDSITIPVQTVNNIGAFVPENHKFKGNASIKNGNIIINYTDYNLSKADTTSGVMYYVKQ